MNAESIHSYAVWSDELTYNLKWTILSHVKYIVGSEEFAGIWEPKLTDESFVDSTPAKFQTKPMFGVEFMGSQLSETENGYVYMFDIAYRGKRGPILLESGYGINSDARRLGFIHDTIIMNFTELTRVNGLFIYDFRIKDNVPTRLDRGFDMILTESGFISDASTEERGDGVDWVYAARLKRVGM